MSKTDVVKNEKLWGLLVHEVVAPVSFTDRSKAVSAIKDWKSRGWEFVSVIELEKPDE